MAEPEPTPSDIPEQAPDTRPVPVPSSAPRQGEIVPPDFPIDDIVAHLEARIAYSYSKSHVGPLPSPETYREYAAIIPNGKERIMVMAEKEQKQRHWSESMEQWRASSGVIFAFILGMSGMGIAAYALSLGQALAASVAFLGTLATLAGVFIKGTAIHEEQRQEEGKGAKEIEQGKDEGESPAE